MRGFWVGGKGSALTHGLIYDLHLNDPVVRPGSRIGFPDQLQCSKLLSNINCNDKEIMHIDTLIFMACKPVDQLQSFSRSFYTPLVELVPSGHG